MSKYASKVFWIDTLDRAIATFAQASIGALTASATGILDIEWQQTLSVSGFAALVSVLTSIAFRRGDTLEPDEIAAHPSTGDV
jgi:hypothetical protein